MNDLKSKLAKKQSRAVRRAEKVAENAALKGESVLKPKKRKPRKIKRGSLKRQIVRLLGLLDAKKNGKLCRFHGNHEGDTSCHIVPQNRGDAARFIPENVYWGCQGANYGEMRHRSLYRDHHIRIFGKDLVERLEAMAREFKKYTHGELLEMRERLKSELAG